MMKKLLLIIPVIVLIACEVAVEVDLPDGGGKMSISGLAQSDSTWRIDIKVSKHILEVPFQFDSVTNATVTITDKTAGTSTVLTHQYHGRYRSNEYPIPGHEYLLTAEAPGFETISATTIVPREVRIKSAVLDTTRVILYKDGNSPAYDTYPLTITFDDFAGLDNTYEVEVYSYSSFPQMSGEDTVMVSSVGVFPSFIVDPGLVLKADFFGGHHYPNRFSDDSFEGQEKTLTVLCLGFVVTSPSVYRLGVRLFNQGFEYSKFVDDRNLQRDAEGDPFAQPVPVYSNVSNHNGIFAVKATNVFEWNYDPK